MGTQTDWLLLTLCWLLGLGALYGQARPLVVETQFTTSSVNDRVWVLTRPLLPPRLVHPARPPAGFWPNPDRDLVRIGAAYQRPQAWLYLPLINPTARPRRLIVDVEHNRCDTLEGFLVRAGQCIKLGSLCRGLPLLQRPLPLRDYALPFTLAPHDTVALLLRSCRTTGGHELNLALSTPAQYLLKRDQEGSLRLLGLGCAFFFTTTVLALGGLFGQRLLIYFGLFGFCLALGQLNYNYYFDSVPFPAGLGLNANSMGLFIIFLVNACFHPFGRVYIQRLRLLRPWHHYAIGGLAAANGLAMSLLLMPLTPLTNAALTNASWLLSTLNIGWLFYMAGLGLVQKRETYLGLTAILVLGPLLYHTFRQQTFSLSYAYFQPFYYLLLFGGLTVALLQNELSSRQRTQQQLLTIQTQLEQLRKADIDRIGRNLHDQLGNTLASALGYLTLAAPKLELARVTLLIAINEARVLSHNLVKDDERPLADKLAELAERFADCSPMSVSYRDYSAGQLNRLPPFQQQSLYLIVQEALTNAVKHSGAGQVSIQAVYSEGYLRLSLEDDGVGFDVPSQGGRAGGIGLSNMAKRAALAGLRLTLESTSGGTWLSLEARLPPSGIGLGSSGGQQ